MDALIIGLIIGIFSPIIVKLISKKQTVQQDAAHEKQVLTAEDMANAQAGGQKSDTALWDRYAAMCKNGNTLQVVCPGYKTEYYALTDMGLIIDNKKGVQFILFTDITSVDFFRMGGGRPTSASECQSISIKADKTYYLGRYSSQFDKIAGELMNRF